MSKCTKVKRPCKICLATVTQRNGLQCQGACQSWVHYSCLNYTPGKIKDIRDGVIRVTCPCPDCKTIMPKEYRTDQPFSCNNQMCPANRPPKCENMRCPINDSERRACPPPSCPLGKCGGSKCKQHSTPQLPYAPVTVCPAPPCVPPPPCPKPVPSLSDGCFDPNRCSSGCSSSSQMKPDIPGDCPPGAVSAVPSMRAVEDMCNTIGLLATQLNDLMCKMQSMSNQQPDCERDPCAVARGYKPSKCPPLPKCPPKPDKGCCCRVRSKKKLI